MGMRSIRLDEALERRLAKLAHRLGLPVSQVIRDAIDAHCDELLHESLGQRIAHAIGVVESEGGRADDTGEAFRRLLVQGRHSL